MRRRHAKRNELNFQNVSSPLGRITLVGFGVRQSLALEKPRVLGQYALVYLVDGRGRYEDANGHRKNLEPGDVLILFPDLAHRYNPLPGTQWVTTYLCFQGPIFDLWLKHGLLDPFKPIHHAEPVDLWARRLESIGDAMRAGSAPPLLNICLLQQLLAEILAGAGRSVSYRNDLQWVARASGLIDANLLGSQDWKEVADQLGLSVESFRKRFTRLFGQPPARYRMGRLIDRACALMQNRNVKDRQIAETLGFCDEFYFSRRFKAITGQSPRQFRLNSLLLGKTEKAGRKAGKLP
jgi:AraC-like DNA-binding protein